MDFQTFKRKAIAHFDNCDVEDVECKYYIDQKKLKKLKLKTTITGQSVKVYDTIYPVMWTFATINPLTGQYQNLKMDSSFMKRSEIHDLYKMCMKFGLSINIWGKYIKNRKIPSKNFTYTGNIMLTLIRDDDSEFTWRDDVLMKTLTLQRGESLSVWTWLRNSQKSRDLKRKRQKYKK